jgi:hypothetical protein
MKFWDIMTIKGRLHIPTQVATSYNTKQRDHGCREPVYPPSGTHAGKREFASVNDFEVVACLVVSPGISEDKRHE